MESITGKCQSLGVASVRSAYFFGGACPLTAWDTFDKEAVDREIHLMKADGFNTVLIVIPLSLAFYEQSHRKFYDHFWENLEYLLGRLEAENLCLAGRLFYVWDNYPSGRNRLRPTIDIFTESDTKRACLRFAQALNERLQRYDRFLFCFICWEDLLPHLINGVPTFDEPARQQIGNLIGYGRAVPRREDLEFGNFLDFLDQLFNAFFEDVRQVFPRLSAEIRVDSTPYANAGGEPRFHSHLAQAKPHADVVCSYYAPYMLVPHGMKEIDDVLAFRAFDYVQGLVAKETPGRIFVDQLLLIIEEKQHAHLPSIRPDCLEPFAKQLAEWLREKALGYATWCFHDYFLEAIGNSNFGLGLDGWSSAGDVQVERVGIAMRGGSSIFRMAARRLSRPHILLDLESSTLSVLQIVYGEGKRFELVVEPGNRIRKVFIREDAGDRLRLNVISGECIVRRASIGWDIASNGGYGFDPNVAVPKAGAAVKLFRDINSSLGGCGSI